MSIPETGVEIIPGDAALRRRWLLVVIASFIVASLYFGYLSAEIGDVRSAADPDIDGLTTQLYWMSMGFVGTTTGLCLYLIVSALRTFSSGRFPPPGTRVLRDTRVRRGAVAMMIGLFNMLAGLVVLLLALYVHWTISRFLGVEILP